MQKADKIFFILKQNNPSPKSELNFNSPYQCFVAVMLSPQCADKLVNKVTPYFFKKFGNFEVLANANLDEVKESIRQINFCNNKAKYLVESAKKILKEFGGQLPCTLEELMTLPGVGRKVAQVLLVECFGKPAVPVDTHVFRTVNRIFGKEYKKPLETEKFIKESFKAEYLPDLHHLLVLHGRYICISKKPKCGQCLINTECQMKNAEKKGVK